MEKITNVEATEQKERRRIGGLVLNVLTGIVLALAVMFLIEGFYANKHLHNNYFGFAIMPVASSSMDAGEKPIKKGDLIFVKLLKEEQKEQLKAGDVITFRYYIHELDAEQLVTHRIQSAERGYYITHGDANPEGSIESVSYNEVVGIYKGKIGAIGHVGLFFQTKAGSFVMIVVPFLVLLLLSLYHFIRNMRVYNKQKIQAVKDEARSDVLIAEKERMRREILAELAKGEGQDKSISQDTQVDQ